VKPTFLSLLSFSSGNQEHEKVKDRSALDVEALEAKYSKKGEIILKPKAFCLRYIFVFILTETAI